MNIAKGGAMMLSAQEALMADIIRFVLRLSPVLHGKLKAMAEREHRSLHGQITHLLEKAVGGEGE